MIVKHHGTVSVHTAYVAIQIALVFDSQATATVTSDVLDYLRMSQGELVALLFGPLTQE